MHCLSDSSSPGLPASRPPAAPVSPAPSPNWLARSGRGAQGAGPRSRGTAVRRGRRVWPVHSLVVSAACVAARPPAALVSLSHPTREPTSGRPSVSNESLAAKRRHPSLPCRRRRRVPRASVVATTAYHRLTTAVTLAPLDPFHARGAMVGAAPDPTGPWPQRSSPVPLRHLQGLHGSIAQCLDSPSPTGSSPGMDFPSNASGASAVAIDNKIEQAMDLVKSHLMFAVREEVEVLKDKIAELMDRINKLELENSILKANATQETLEQLLLAPKPCDVAALQQNGVPAQQGGQQNGGATP